MNIIFVMQDTGSIYGAEQATLDLVKGLSDSGVVPGFLLLHEDRLGLARSSLREAIDAAGYGCHALSVASPFSFKLVREIRQYAQQFDSVILHAVGYKADVHVGLAAKWGRFFPVVSTVHGWLYRPDIKEQFYAWVDLFVLKRLSHVVVLSSYYEALLRKKGIPASRLSCIPSGLHAVPEGQGGSRAANKDDVVCIGMLGRLSGEKNHGMLLHAIRLLKTKASHPFKALIAGTGPLKKEIEQRIVDMGLADICILTGYVDSHAFLEDIDILVHCSHIENLPYSIMEAMAHRVPVVATAVGGIPDLIVDKDSGFLVRDDDHEGLTGVLDRLIRNPGLRREVGGNGCKRMLTAFSRERNTERHVALYRSLL